MASKATSATCPRIARRSVAGVVLVIITCVGSAGQAADASPTVPAAEIPTIEGTRDATMPPGQEPAGGGAGAPAVTAVSPPAPAGTLSSWRAAKDRSAIRIGSEFRADELLGAAVIDREGRAVGRIEDLLIDTDGMVRKAILHTSDAAAGSRSVIIDLLQLRRQRASEGFVLEPARSDPVPPE